MNLPPPYLGTSEASYRYFRRCLSVLHPHAPPRRVPGENVRHCGELWARETVHNILMYVPRDLGAYASNNLHAFSNLYRVIYLPICPLVPSAVNYLTNVPSTKAGPRVRGTFR